MRVLHTSSYAMLCYALHCCPIAHVMTMDDACKAYSAGACVVLDAWDGSRRTT